jgi:hypothetical protein
MELNCNLCDYDKEKSKMSLKNCSDKVNTYLKNKLSESDYI